MTEDHRYTIIEGDCIKGMNSLPEGCVQTCITSPPYFGLRDYKGGEEEIGQEDTVDGYVAKMVEVFRSVRRVLRDDGTVWLNLGDSYMSAKNCAPPPQTVANGNYRSMPTDFVPANRKDQRGLKSKDLIGIPWRVAFALQADGWYLRQDIIWHKPNPMPESVEDRCTKAHEYIFLLTKSQKYYYDSDVIKEAATTAPANRDKASEGYQADYPHGDRFSKGERVWGADNKKNKRSVWMVTTKPFRGAHFATFPPDLIEPCVLAGCPEGGTVLDPFTGSGTTCVVSLKHGRKFIGTELNPEYIKIATERISDECPIPLTDLFT